MSKEILERAIKTFQDYCIKTNPGEFEEGAVAVSLTGTNPAVMVEKGYNLARYGGFIRVHDYLMGIHATDDLEIAECSLKK